jgi:outer membrane protein TolC
MPLRLAAPALRALTFVALLVAWLPGSGACQQVVAAPDTAASIGPQLALETIIARTLVHSPIVAGAQGVVRDARAAQRVAALGAYLPAIFLNGITGKTTQSVSSSSTAATTSSSVESTAGVGIAAAVDVFTGGRRGALRTQANALVRSGAANLVLQRYATVFTATQGYLDVLHAHELTRVAADQVAQARLGLDYALRRQAAGTAMLADVLSAQLAVSTARQAQLAAADTLAMSAAALGRLVGADGPVDAQPATMLEPTPLPLSDTDIVALAVATAPAVVTTQAQAKADTAGVRAARALYIPTIAAGAGYNWGTTSPFAGGLRPGWIVELTASYPIFDGFLREQTITQAEVASDVATASALDTRRFVGASAVTLLGSLHVTEHDIELARESVRLATENLRVFRLRYNAGIATILDVLTAQTSLIQAELSLVSARFKYRSTRASLEALLGRAL